jgi:hypothetical protein
MVRQYRQATFDGRYKTAQSKQETMKNGTIINVFGEPIEIIASSSATNYAFVIGLQEEV